MGLSIVILAAGNGKRMHSPLPKVLHTLAGKPLLLHVVRTAQSLNPDAIYIVYGYGGMQVRQAFADLNVNWIEQPQPLGTGNAVLQAMTHLPDDDQVLILYGDVPLITQTTLKNFLQATQSDQLGLLVKRVKNPNGFGRIVRDANDKIIAIVEHKDATEEQLAIQEINTGIMTSSAASLKKWLPQLQNKNAQGEYYLTDVIAMAVRDKKEIVATMSHCTQEVSGVNDRRELITLERYYQQQKAQELLEKGVTIMDPNRFDCRGEVTIAANVTIDVNVILEGHVTIEEGAYIGPNTWLKDVHIGKNVQIKPNCVIEGATLGAGARVGPFTRIRPDTHLGEYVQVGNFVELKHTTIENGSKANHLSYLGDAKIGADVNIGAGTITCNYDGEHKYQTVIKNGAFIGSGTELVAPIVVGEKAYVGAGSTLTKDAPDNELTLARARQVTIKDWQKKT